MRSVVQTKMLQFNGNMDEQLSFGAVKSAIKYVYDNTVMIGLQGKSCFAPIEHFLGNDGNIYTGLIATDECGLYAVGINKEGESQKVEITSPDAPHCLIDFVNNTFTPFDGTLIPHPGIHMNDYLESVISEYDTYNPEREDLQYPVKDNADLVMSNQCGVLTCEVIRFMSDNRGEHPVSLPVIAGGKGDVIKGIRYNEQPEQYLAVTKDDEVVNLKESAEYAEVVNEYVEKLLHDKFNKLVSWIHSHVKEDMKCTVENPQPGRADTQYQIKLAVKDLPLEDNTIIFHNENNEDEYLVFNRNRCSNLRFIEELLSD